MDAAHLYNRSLIRLILINALIKPIWILGIDRWVQVEVGMAAYGSYFSVWGLTLTAGFLLDLGLTTFVQREAASGQTKVDQLPNLFWMKLLLLGFYFLFIAGIGWLYPSISPMLLWGVAGIQALHSTYLYFRSWVTAAQDFVADVWFSVLDKVLLILVCFCWLMGFWSAIPVRMEAFIGWQLLTLTLSLAVVVFYLFRTGVPLPGRFRLSFSWVRLAWPYAGIVLLMSALTRLDGYWLTSWHARGDWEAGRYAAGYRLLDAANMFGYLVASFLLPYLARNRSNQQAIRLALITARNGLVGLSVLVVLLTSLFAQPIAALLYPGSADWIASILPTLLASMLGYSLIHVYGTALTARGDLLLFQAVIGCFLLLHILLAAWWIPGSGALGVARAALISQLGAGITLMFLVHRRMNIPQPLTTHIVVIFTGSLLWALN